MRCGTFRKLCIVVPMTTTTTTEYVLSPVDMSDWACELTILADGVDIGVGKLYRTVSAGRTGLNKSAERARRGGRSGIVTTIDHTS